jgi:hypothetical protein
VHMDGSGRRAPLINSGMASSGLHSRHPSVPVPARHRGAVRTSPLTLSGGPAGKKHVILRDYRVNVIHH